MIYLIDKILKSNNAPLERNVLWLDTSVPDQAILKAYVDGEWRGVSDDSALIRELEQRISTFGSDIDALKKQVTLLRQLTGAANVAILSTTDANIVLSKFSGYNFGFASLRETIRLQNALGKHCYFVYEGPAKGNSNNSWWVPTWLNEDNNVCFFKEGIAYECSEELSEIRPLDFTPEERQTLEWVNAKVNTLDLISNVSFAYPADGYYNSKGVVTLSMLGDPTQYNSEDWKGVVNEIKTNIASGAKSRAIDQKYINYYYPMYDYNTYAATWLDEKDRICYFWNGVPYRLDDGKEREPLRITDEERERLANHEDYISFIKNIYPKDDAFVYNNTTTFIYNSTDKRFTLEGGIRDYGYCSYFFNEVYSESAEKPCYLKCVVQLSSTRRIAGYAKAIKGTFFTYTSKYILLLPNGCYVSIEDIDRNKVAIPLSNPFFTDAEIQERDDKVTAIETTANASKEQITQMQSSVLEARGKASEALSLAQANETAISGIREVITPVPSIINYLTTYDSFTQATLYSKSFEVTPDRAAGNLTTLTTDDFDDVCKFIIDNYNKPCFMSLTVITGDSTIPKENFRILKTIGAPPGGSAAFASGSVKELFMVSPEGMVIRLANSSGDIKSYLIDTFVDKNWSDGINQRISTFNTQIISINRKLDMLKTTGDGTKFLSDNGQYVTVSSGGGTTTSLSWDSITGKPTGLVIDASYVHTDNNFTTAEKNKLAGLSSTGSGVTGVKGSAEASYRTGQVNISLENLGLALTDDNKIPADRIAGLEDVLSYGITFTNAAESFTCKRIGNPNYHRTLPIQSKMKGCVYKDNRIQYYLNPNDWTKKYDGAPAKLDGTDGNVMVQFPTFYGCIRHVQNEIGMDAIEIRIAETKLTDEYVKITGGLVSAYKLTVDRTHSGNLKAASVQNRSELFRGSMDNPDLDNEENPAYSNLNKGILACVEAPSTMATYCNNAGMKLLNFQTWKWLYILYAIEYASFCPTLMVNNELDANGYKQGGLGLGTTDVSDMDILNSLPVCQNGLTNLLGNNSGEQVIELLNGQTTQACRWRGIEQPFGDCGVYLDACIIEKGTDKTTLTGSKFIIGKDNTVFSDGGRTIISKSRYTYDILATNITQSAGIVEFDFSVPSNIDAPLSEYFSFCPKEVNTATNYYGYGCVKFGTTAVANSKVVRLFDYVGGDLLSSTGKKANFMSHYFDTDTAASGTYRGMVIYE